MTDRPEVDAFARALEQLRRHPAFRGRFRGNKLRLAGIERADLKLLMGELAGLYFLSTAAGLTRTTRKRAARAPEATIVEASEREAFALQKKLPLECVFSEIVAKALEARRGHLERMQGGGIEGLFRERLAKERIPIVMSPPVRRVPGVLIEGRKPDGVFPDPATGLAPRLYLEIKNIKRPSDDIQKRLYEVAEAALEMKLLYGDLRLQGFGLATTQEVVAGRATLQGHLRNQVRESLPVVVVLFLCPRADAERYRPGAEAFVDRVFFEEEVEECIAFLRESTRTGR